MKKRRTRLLRDAKFRVSEKTYTSPRSLEENHKYRYLGEVDYVKAWVEGGKIPIFLASRYLSDERAGILTPDENLIHESTLDISKLIKSKIVEGQFGDVTMVGCTYYGQPIPDIHHAKYYVEDGIILSFCNTFDVKIARRLEKKACVRIENIFELKKVIDRQLRVVGKIGPCKYTNDHQRNHFLKSVEDEWQDEFRIFWPIKETKWVTIPGGLASEMVLEIDA